ncbi:hypothetical protein [Parendozoicomonas sp. Alg238-R29]|uniref:hypothetical protein n=1 Tax=Parendozoicomonas sp. Alg238-R29 TaxID=2993446 RepID=UPI00248E6B23|nr:hypothetical protein [Parendozoicomonas sp. Alg238-R29]
MVLIDECVFATPVPRNVWVGKFKGNDLYFAVVNYCGAPDKGGKCLLLEKRASVGGYFGATPSTLKKQ